nr:integrase, catalytic region, zinc finger, CCHC-type, peptidase aspartic, catalytic [Tanacetum cinerariifolium]
EQNNEFNEQMKVLNEENADLLAQTKVLQDQLKVKHFVIDTHAECQAQYAKLEEERYEYMIRYSDLCDNDKQHRKKIDKQEILFDKMSRQLVEMNNNVLRLQEKILEKETKNFRVGRVYLDTFSSVRRPRQSSVIWKKKGSSNTFNVDLSSVCHSKLNKDVKRYSRKDLLSFNNSHLGETSGAYDCNDVMNVFCNSRLYDSFDENNLFIFDDVGVRNSPVSKMSFKKKPRNSMNVRSKSNSNKSLHRTVYRWLLKMQPLAKPVAKWIPRVERQIDKISKTPNSSGPIFKRVPKVFRMSLLFYLLQIVQICLWIIDSGCSKHMTGNRVLLMNFVEKFLETVRFGNNDFAIIAGYRDVVIGSMTIKKVYYVEGLGHNLFSDVGKLKVKGDIRVFVGYSKESAAFRIYNKQTRKIYESVNVNFDEILETASKQFSLEPGLSNLNETGKSSNLVVSQVSETSKKDLEDLFHNFYDEYFDASKIIKSSTINVETSNVEIPLNEEEVFHESSESFQEESSSSSLNDGVQQSSKEVRVSSSNTQSISNNMVPNVDEA